MEFYTLQHQAKMSTPLGKKKNKQHTYCSTPKYRTVMCLLQSDVSILVHVSLLESQTLLLNIFEM